MVKFFLREICIVRVSHGENGGVHPNEVLHDFTHRLQLFLVLLDYLVVRFHSRRLPLLYGKMRGESRRKEDRKEEGRG